MYFEKSRLICTVKTFSGRNPASTRCRLIRLRTISPAPISKRKETATCATINAPRVLLRRAPVVDCVPPSFSVAARFPRRAQRRRCASQNADQRRDAQREQQHLRIDVNFVGARREARDERGEQFQSAGGEKQSEQSAAECEPIKSFPSAIGGTIARGSRPSRCAIPFHVRGAPCARDSDWRRWRTRSAKRSPRRPRETTSSAWRRASAPFSSA